MVVMDSSEKKNLLPVNHLSYEDIKASTVPEDSNVEVYGDIDFMIFSLARDMGWELSQDMIASFRDKAKLAVLERMAFKWVWEDVNAPPPADDDEEETEA